MRTVSDGLDLDIRLSAVGVPVPESSTTPEPEPEPGGGTCVSLVCTGSGNLCEKPDPDDPDE
jgi:hypothetical protein